MRVQLDCLNGRYTAALAQIHAALDVRKRELSSIVRRQKGRYTKALRVVRAQIYAGLGTFIRGSRSAWQCALAEIEYFLAI